MSDIAPAAREAARSAAQAKLAGLFAGQLGIDFANEVADAALDAAWPHLAAPDKAECPVCHRDYRTRTDGHVRTHNAPRSIQRCAGSPKE